MKFNVLRVDEEIIFSLLQRRKEHGTSAATCEQVDEESIFLQIACRKIILYGQNYYTEIVSSKK